MLSRYLYTSDILSFFQRSPYVLWLIHLMFSPSIVETYSRLLVYSELETLGIKGYLSQVLPKVKPNVVTVIYLSNHETSLMCRYSPRKPGIFCTPCWKCSPIGLIIFRLTTGIWYDQAYWVGAFPGTVLEHGFLRILSSSYPPRWWQSNLFSPFTFAIFCLRRCMCLFTIWVLQRLKGVSREILTVLFWHVWIG